MAADKPTVSIAVLTFNRARRLRELLAALAPLVGPDVELIVVDNHSEDETQDVIRDCGVALTCIRTDSNIGVTARNLGLRRAAGEIIVCLDDDVFGIDGAALETIVRAFRADARLAAVNFKVLDPWTGGLCNWVHHCEEERFADATFDTYEITEGAVAFRRAALAEAGWYPETFFLSHEGPDLAFRLLDRGYKVVYRGDIAVQHWHDSSGRKSWMTYYYDTRNQYWLAARNLPAGYALRYLVRGQLSTCVYALRDGHLLHWLRAVRDGVAGLGDVWGDRRTVRATTLAAIRQMDARRPSLAYMARKRLFRRDMRL